MSQPHVTTPAAPTSAEARTQANLPPLEFLEWLISEAQQATRAAQTYAGRLEVPGDAQFDVLTQLGPAIRHLDAAMQALAAYMPAPELPALPSDVAIVEG